MERWKIAEQKRVKTEKIDAFLAEVIELSKKHGLSIGHEDHGGGFLVDCFRQDYVDWLMDASDATKEADEDEASQSDAPGVLFIERAHIVETPDATIVERSDVRDAPGVLFVKRSVYEADPWKTRASMGVKDALEVLDDDMFDRMFSKRA